METNFAFKPLRYFISTPSAGAEAFFVHFGYKAVFCTSEAGTHEQIADSLTSILREPHKKGLILADCWTPGEVKTAQDAWGTSFLFRKKIARGDIWYVGMNNARYNW